MAQGKKTFKNIANPALNFANPASNFITVPDEVEEVKVEEKKKEAPVKKAAEKAVETKPEVKTVEKAAEKPKRPSGRPKNENLIRGGSQDGLTAQYDRVTLLLDVDLYKKFEAVAYTTRKTKKQLINEYLKFALDHDIAQLKKQGIEIIDPFND